jgi:thiol-disulfide isomerase/thioredoxin
MIKRLYKTLGLILLLSLLLLTGCSVNSEGALTEKTKNNSEPKIGLGIGNQAPDFTITMDNGQSLKLSELKGQPVFLNFWASWCPPCKKEMPDIEKIFKEERKVKIIAVNIKETPMEVRSFLNSNGFTFPIGYDPKGEISSLYMATGIPTSYAIDRNGIIRHQIQGPLTYAQLNQWFTNLENI